jgi:branched-chain amino acid transport system substrate-binding protein
MKVRLFGHRFSRPALLLAGVFSALVWSHATASAQGTIVFGAPLPITGGLAPEAAKAQQGYNLWADTVNAAGGIKVGDKKMKVKIVYVDYQSNTPRAVQATEKLITQQKVNFLFAPFGSGATKASSALAAKYKMVTLAPTASSPQVYDRGNKYLFGIYTPNATLTVPLVNIVKGSGKNLKTLAILARNDFFPLALARQMKASAKAGGIKVVFEEKFAVNTLDHSATLTQMKALKPDWIFVAGYINDNALVRKQMLDLKVKAPVVTMLTGPSYPEFITAAGKAGAENVTGAAWWHPALQYKSNDIFGSTQGYVNTFKKKFGFVPDYGHASHTAVGVIFQMAIEKAGSIDREKVRAALASLKANTFHGPMSFSGTGQADSYKPPVFQIQGGKTVIIYPQVVKQADFRLDTGAK